MPIALCTLVRKHMQTEVAKRCCQMLYKCGRAQERTILPFQTGFLQSPYQFSACCCSCLHTQSALCASVDRKHSQHLIFFFLVSLPTPSPKGKETERGQRMLLIPIIREYVCVWLLCEKCDEEITTHTGHSNQSLVNYPEVFIVKFRVSLLRYMQNSTGYILIKAKSCPQSYQYCCPQQVSSSM